MRTKGFKMLHVNGALNQVPPHQLFEQFFDTCIISIHSVKEDVIVLALSYLRHSTRNPIHPQSYYYQILHVAFNFQNAYTHWVNSSVNQWSTSSHQVNHHLTTDEYLKGKVC